MKTQIAKMAIASLLITSSLNADFNSKSISVGVASVDIMNESSMGYTVGFGYAKTISNNFYLGGGVDFDINEFDEEASYAYGANLKLGYSPLENFAAYGVVGALYQGIGEGTTGYGFGYGAGIDYKIFDSFGVSAEYVTNTMSLDGLIDYDYNKMSFNLKYLY